MHILKTNFVVSPKEAIHIKQCEQDEAWRLHEVEEVAARRDSDAGISHTDPATGPDPRWSQLEGVKL